ncbi:MAG: hypothetical protein RIG82_07570 [Phycisphaeraceae bacterium]
MSRLMLMGSVLGASLLLVGCGSNRLMIDLEAPQGSTVTFRGDTDPTPAMIKVPRPGDVEDKPARKAIEFDFVLGGETIPAQGVLETFGFEEQDVDRLSKNFLKIQPSHIRDIERGSAIVLNGTSASGQHIYQLTIGQER